MKKFFTLIPLQGKLTAYHYTPVGNQKLDMEGEICFPILSLINGYAEQGETIEVVAAVPDDEAARRNLETFRQEVNSLCEKKNLTCKLHCVEIANQQQVTVQVDTFQKLIDYVAEDDELFACITYGTKPMSMALMMAVQYAYRVKQNTSIGCVVYGQINWSGETRSASVYDMTALVQLDEIVRILADRGVANPKETIRAILAL